MTSYKAEQIMFELWMQKSLTPTQMCCVSKTLCFSHELRGFPKKVNWPSVRKIQALIIESELAPKKFSVVPTRFRPLRSSKLRSIRSILRNAPGRSSRGFWA